MAIHAEQVFWVTNGAGENHGLRDRGLDVGTGRKVMDLWA